MKLKHKLKKYFSEKQIKKIVSVKNYLKTFFKSDDLSYLAQVYETDKYGVHFYTQHYQNHFNKFRNQKINILEIGIGGYENPKAGGDSLRMWKRFFSKGNIYAIDIYDKSFHDENRIKTFKGSQVDSDFLKSVITEIGELDLIVDDGSHINEHVVATFELLFPHLKEGGIYVVEDTQTSYWKSFGGESTNLKSSNTLLNYFKTLTDCLNHKEFMIENYTPSYYDKNIISMHFYHNMVFIYKGKNNEESNVLVDNKMPVKETTF